MISNLNKDNKFFQAKNELSVFGSINNKVLVFSPKGLVDLVTQQSIFVYNGIGSDNFSSDNPFSDQVVFWDLFGTSSLYVSPNTFNSIEFANNVIPLVYLTSVINKEDLSKYETEPGTAVSVPIPSGDSINFIRIKSSDNSGLNLHIDGWATQVHNVFHCKEDKDVIKLDILNDNFDELISKEKFKDLIKKDLSNVLSNKFKKFEKPFFGFISKNNEDTNSSLFDAFPNSIDKVADSQSQINYFETLERNKNKMNNSCPSCIYYTCQSSDLDQNQQQVNIVSKEYAFANIPKDVPICSHPDMRSSEGLTYCLWVNNFDTNQSNCSFYTPNQIILKNYTTEGSNSISFNAVWELDTFGKQKVSIYNANIGELSYCIYPPSSATHEEILNEVDQIVKDVLTSWSSEVADTLRVDTHKSDESVVETKEKKSFILSLV